VSFCIQYFKGSEFMFGITVLGSGSRGNAIFLHGRQDGGILIDAGFSGIEVRRRLAAVGISEEDVRAILISHEHDDHTRALGTLAKRWQVPIYTNRLTAQALRDRIKNLGPVTVFGAGTSFKVAEFEIEPFSIPHDAIDPVGFVVERQGLKVGVATDLGHASSLVSHLLQECDALVLESNHDIPLLQESARPWSLKQRVLSRHGHLSNEACMALFRQVVHSKTKHVILAHASQDCNRYELVESSVRQCLADLNRQDIGAHIARQDAPLPTIWLQRDL
jgi:phosphoribosyl 1,2-cyclic phosphodiesterase